MRFLHTSDWHLGRIFHGVHLTEDQSHVLEQLVQVIKDSQVDAVVIAGDIYDRSVPPVEAVALLNNTLDELLLGCGTPVLMIAGNHDSPERLGFASRLLEKQGLYVAGSVASTLAPVVLEDEWGPVYFAPLPYAEPVMVREMLASPQADCHEAAVAAMVKHILRQIPKEARKIAVGHAFLAGGKESPSERPLSVGGSASVSPGLFAPFHYTALGHLHNSQQAGQAHVRYSGSLLKYSFDEADHVKGVNIVEIDGMGSVRFEKVSLSPRRDVRCVKGLFRDVLKAGLHDHKKEDYLLVSLEDEEPILDAMGQLRQIYPNVLQLERPYLSGKGQLQGVEGDHRKLGEAELFASFFDQMTGGPMSEVQAAELAQALEEIHRHGREVKV